MIPQGYQVDPIQVLQGAKDFLVACNLWDAFIAGVVICTAIVIIAVVVTPQE